MSIKLIRRAKQYEELYTSAAKLLDVVPRQTSYSKSATDLIRCPPWVAKSESNLVRVAEEVGMVGAATRDFLLDRAGRCYNIWNAWTHRDA